MTPHGYVYHTFCAASGRHYVGQHVGARFDPFYFGSGTLLRRALVKHGEDAFTVTPIKWVESQAELDIQEIWFIAAYRKQYGRERMYNLADGGEGGATFTGRHHSENARKKMSVAAKKRTYARGWHHSPETIKKNRASNIGKQLGHHGYWEGKHFSDDHKKKIAEAGIGRAPWNKGLNLGGKSAADRNREYELRNRAAIAERKRVYYRTRKRAQAATGD